MGWPKGVPRHKPDSSAGPSGPVFISLTFPDSSPVTPDVAEAFRKRLQAWIDDAPKGKQMLLEHW